MSEKELNKPDIYTKTAKLVGKADQDHYADALRCNRCGFCTSYCPTYLATGDEGMSPRGRNQAFRAVLEGRLTDPAQAENLFSTCLLCGICTSVCFSEVPTAKLMSAAREKVMEKRGEPFFLKLVLRALLPRPWLFEPLVKIAFLGKKLGLSRALNRLGLLRFLSPQLAAAEEMSEDVPLRFLRARLARRAAPSELDVVQFLACGPNYIKPEVGEATARLIDATGLRAGVVRNVCCGMPGVSYGDMEAARLMATKNIEALEKHPRAVILLDDSSCASTVKEYPSLFEEGSEWRTRAEAVSRRTKDLSEWLLDVHPQALQSSSSSSPQSVKVTYHDPCKARYAQKIIDPPRRLLAALPGVDFHELPEADQCCGGGGTYSFVHPDISRAVLDRKTRNIVSTEAQEVLTSSVSCLLQVEFGLRRAKSKIKAAHLAEFLAPPPSEKP